MTELTEQQRLLCFQAGEQVIRAALTANPHVPRWPPQARREWLMGLLSVVVGCLGAEYQAAGDDTDDLLELMAELVDSIPQPQAEARRIIQ